MDRAGPEGQAATESGIASRTDRLKAKLRVPSGKDRPSSPPPEASARADGDGVAELRDRLAHLEQVVEGLQDAIHRHSMRLDQEMHELRERTRPGQMARALSDDARKRGL